MWGNRLDMRRKVSRHRLVEQFIKQRIPLRDYQMPRLIPFHELHSFYLKHILELCNQQIVFLVKIVPIMMLNMPCMHCSSIAEETFGVS